MVKQGETVEVETWDAYGGAVSPERSFQQAIEKGVVGDLNPMLYLDGAMLKSCYHLNP